MIWENFTQDLRHHPGGLVEKVAHVALRRWAFNPSHHLTKTAREALCASLTGACVVSSAIEKLAFSDEEKAFLHSLNNEIAGREVSLLKEADASSVWAAHPEWIGAALGAGVGAGLGAWKDEDNRLRGAAMYAVPGAVLGGMSGAMIGEGIDHIRSLEKGFQTVNNIDAKLPGQIKNVVESAQDAQGDLAKMRALRARSPQPSGPSIRDTAAMAEFDRRLARSAAAAKAEAALKDKWRNAISTMADQRANAERMHEAMVDAAGYHRAFATDPQHQTYYSDIGQYLKKRKAALIEHMTVNPNKIHPEMHLFDPDTQPFVNNVVNKARQLFREGPSP